MPKRKPKILNSYELKLQTDILKLLKECNQTFYVFMPILRNDLPNDIKSNDYKIKYRTEYMKLLRASFSVDEIRKMLKKLNYEIILTLNDKKIDFKKYKLKEVKVKYTELMAVCEVLGIKITWVNINK